MIPMPPYQVPVMRPVPAREKRGFHMCCVVCNLAEAYCACGKATPDAPSGDATAEARLNKRITDVARAGGI